MCDKKGELLCPEGISALGGAWHRRFCDEITERAMMQRHNLSALTARVLTTRGIDEDIAAHATHIPQHLTNLDSSLVPFMAQAAQQLAQAIKSGKRIGIITDYDVDGASAAAVLCHYLRDAAGMQLGTHIYVSVPDRLSEGYGPNEQALAQLSAQGIEVLLVLDCGSNAHALLGGLDDKTVIIIDHHQLWRQDWGRGDGCWLVNPHHQDITQDAPYIDACAAVLAFLFVLQVNRCLRADSGGIDEARLCLYSGFVALAVVCDMVSMRADNYRLTREGLRVLNSLEADECYGGVRALWRLCRRGGALDEEGIAFALGPRLNAGSRMGQSHYAFDVLMNGKDAQAKAESLDTLNQQRRSQQDEITQRLKDNPAQVVWDKKGSENSVGCVGLVAATLARSRHKPSFVFAQRQDGLWVGSARTGDASGSCDVGAWVHEATEQGFLKGGGGHAAAAGMQAQDEDQLLAFRAFIDKKMQGYKVRAAPLLVDGVLGLPLEKGKPALNFALWQELEGLRPWGMGYAKPSFMLSGVVLDYVRFMGEGRHMQCRLRAQKGRGGTVEGTVFNCHETPLGDFLENAKGSVLDVVGSVECDSFGGHSRLRLQMSDARSVRLRKTH